MAGSGAKGLYDHEHCRHLLRFAAANPDLDELLGLWVADEDTFKLIHAEEAALFEREFRAATAFEPDVPRGIDESWLSG